MLSAETVAVVSKLEVVVESAGAHHLSFEDLTISDSRGDVVRYVNKARL